jgi:hypothetical protein
MKALDAWRVDRRIAFVYFLEQAKVMSALNNTNVAARTLLAVFCWPKTSSDLVLREAVWRARQRCNLGWPETIVSGQLDVIIALTGVHGSSLQKCLTVVPRHPRRWMGR